MSLFGSEIVRLGISGYSQLNYGSFSGKEERVIVLGVGPAVISSINTYFAAQTSFNDDNAVFSGLDDSAVGVESEIDLFSDQPFSGIY